MIHSVVLDFIHVSGSHTGKRIAFIVNNIIEKYHLHGKIVGLVVDNARANDVAVDEVAKALGLSSETYPTSEEVHFRCFAHILNICCQGKNCLRLIWYYIIDNIQLLLGPYQNKMLCQGWEVKLKRYLLSHVFPYFVPLVKPFSI